MSVELMSTTALATRSNVPATSARSAGTEMPKPAVAEVSKEVARSKAERPSTASRDIDRVAREAAQTMFRGRELDVRGFLDSGSGRFVYRISDRDSGEVLAQTPPDALLRFFASYQEKSAQPLVSVDA